MIRMLKVVSKGRNLGDRAQDDRSFEMIAEVKVTINAYARKLRVTSFACDDFVRKNDSY